MISLATLLAKAPPPAGAVSSSSSVKPPDAAKLRKLAEAMQASIDAKRNPSIGNMRVTARRARIAEGMEQDARRLEEIQRALFALAAAAEAGELPRALWPLRTRALVEDLYRHAEAPGRVFRDEVDRILGRTAGSGDRAAHRRVMAWVETWPSGEARRQLDDPAVAEALLVLVKGQLAGWLEEQASRWVRAHGAGLGTPAAWAAAHRQLREITETYAPARGGPSSAEQNVRRLERALIGKRIPGYVPTPKRIVARMLAKVRLGPGMRTLEPSAGKGDIADALRATGASVDVVELNHELRQVLEAKGHHLVGGDTFAYTGTGYDAVLMNPPFEGLADIDHVRHAYARVRDGGTLVAIMSEGPFFRKDRKAVAFREWLDAVGGMSEELPHDAFEESEVPVSVPTRLVTIRKR